MDHTNYRQYFYHVTVDPILINDIGIISIQLLLRNSSKILSQANTIELVKDKIVACINTTTTEVFSTKWLINIV